MFVILLSNRASVLSSLFVLALTCGAFLGKRTAAQEIDFSRTPAGDLFDPITGDSTGPSPSSQRTGTASGAEAKKPNPLADDSRLARLFGDVDQIDQLSDVRRPNALSPAANAVFQTEASGRRTADVGSLLDQSKATQGVNIQHRTPIISDTRVRGQRVGQILASGSYWAPARMDLDTMMSKIDSRLVEDLILIKGPYAARYGPSFRVVDLEFVQSPRYANRELHGSTSAVFNSNGEHWYGRQSAWGGDENYGFHLSYGHQTANDYETGQDGFSMPSSFKSRDIFLAFGRDISSHESIEFNYLRLDQTDVEFPGLVFDINFLVTDGYEVTYTNTDPLFFSDEFRAEVWYNRTRFEGDSTRSGKINQIPTLPVILESPSGTDGFAVTDVDALSGGYRFENLFRTRNGSYRMGTDLIVINQELNDIEPLGPANDNNFPIPRSHSIDVGLYIEDVEQINSCLTMTAGGRLDGVFTDSREFVAGVPTAFSDLKDSELDQAFLLGAAYLTADYQLGNSWSTNLGAGFASRAPTLTEMYTELSFIGSLQRGLTFLLGDPKLRQEKLYQLDAALAYDGKDRRFGLQGYYSWIEDYITYDLLDPPGTSDGFQEGAAFVNTDLAVLSGVECYFQNRISRMLTLFGTSSYTEGRDLTRSDPARLSTNANRSATPGIEEEPLPGIAPWETRVGILLEDPIVNPRWGIEFMARIVDNQDRIARTLDEIETPGFTTYNLRAYGRRGPWLVTTGIENLTDKFYREHIDYRSGRGVFRPGISAYLGAELTY